VALSVVVIGAHPDDCEIFAGGTALRWLQTGARVTMVSATNGDAGHFAEGGGALARRRAVESAAPASRFGYTSIVLDHHDGELLPTLALRKDLIRVIRQARADVVITHRPWDYHPDHRYTAMAVQDAAYLVMVPNLCPDTPRLETNPVFLYMMDRFQKPYPFQPDIAVDVGPVMEDKWAMIAGMESQLYEWLPWLDGALDSVPAEVQEREEWLRRHWEPFFLEPAGSAGEALATWYGPAAESVRYAELFEVCEYGTQPTRAMLRRLFPFLPEKQE